MLDQTLSQILSELYRVVNDNAQAKAELDNANNRILELQQLYADQVEHSASLQAELDLIHEKLNGPSTEDNVT